jgi:peptidyl-tRNA hydrolase
MNETTEMSGILTYKLYILIRNDLPSMNAGKAMAQAAHAANLFMEVEAPNQKITEWKKDRGFGTTIVLSVDGNKLRNILSNAASMRQMSGYVHDPTYPYIVNKEISGLIDPNIHTDDMVFKNDDEVICFRKELTCGYLFLADGSTEQEELVGSLPLHP